MVPCWLPAQSKTRGLYSIFTIPEETNLVDKFVNENVYVLSIYDSPESVLPVKNLQTNKMDFLYGKITESEPSQPIKE